MNAFYFTPSNLYSLEEPSRWSLDFYTSSFALGHSRPKAILSQPLRRSWLIQDSLNESAILAKPLGPSAWKCATRQ